jgi:hypothetical protein
MAMPAPPGPAVRARRPRANGGHPTSPTCRPSARLRGPAVYREYSSVGVCLLHGAYGCNSVQHAADTHNGRHRAPCDRRRACSAQRATTGEACLHVGLPLRHHRLRLENCTARRTNANTHKRSARARRYGASAHWAPPRCPRAAERVRERPPTAGVAACCIARAWHGPPSMGCAEIPAQDVGVGWAQSRC